MEANGGRETTEFTNRELVESFILDYKLSQGRFAEELRPGKADGGDGDPAAGVGPTVNGHRTNRGAPERSRAPRCPGIRAVAAVLVDSDREFEQLFTQEFGKITLQLDVSPNTARGIFRSVMDEVFKDGINWGRIVGLFAFGGELCVECVEKNMLQLVPHIIDWMTLYLDEHIDPWIQSNGGWEHFAKIFRPDAREQIRRRRETQSKCLMLGLAVFTGALLVAFFKKL